MAVIKVGYGGDMLGMVTRKYEILDERPDGKYKVRSFTVMCRPDGSHWVASGKPIILSKIKNIHMEEVDE